MSGKTRLELLEKAAELLHDCITSEMVTFEADDEGRKVLRQLGYDIEEAEE